MKHIALVVGLIAGVAGVCLAVQQPHASPQTIEELRRSSPDVEPPRLIHHVSPDYPETLRREREQGVVTLSFTVDEKGKTRDISVTRSTNPKFNSNAIDAVKQWLFKPATVQGRPVAVAVHADLTFSLR